MTRDEPRIDDARPFGESVPAGEPVSEEALKGIREAFASDAHQEKIKSLQWALAKSAEEAMSRWVG